MALYPLTLTDDHLNQLCRPEIEAYLPLLIRDMEAFGRRASDAAQARMFRDGAQEVRDRGLSYYRFITAVGPRSVGPNSPEALAAIAREVAQGRGLARTPERPVIQCFWDQILANLERRPLRDGTR